MGIFSGLLDLIFPPRCVFCHKFLKTSRDEVCEACKASLPYTEHGGAKTAEHFTICVSPLFYDGAVRESMLRFKFKEATGYSKVYGRLVAECIDENLKGRYDLISWVPLGKKRLRERGYDQAMLLALSAALELSDVAVSTLEKVTDTQKQSQMGSAENRQANISGAYIASDAELIFEKRILLIDDVVTTGSTLSECAKTLLAAGAAEVLCAAVARTKDENI